MQPILAAVLLAGAAAACAAPALPGGTVAPEPTLAARTSTDQSRPTVAVRRGSIVDAISVLGKVISTQESDLYFRTNGRLKARYVESGAEVKAGQLLAELETGDLATRIAQAKTAVAAAQTRVEQARAKVVVDDSALDQDAVAQAQLGLDQAQRQLDRLQAGPTEADVKTAEAAVADASAGADKAHSDVLAREADVRAKQALLDLAQQGAAPEDVAAAEAAVAVAKIKLDQAKAGPIAEDVAAAQLKLEQAKTKLAALRDAPPVSQADVDNAAVVVQAAQVNLDKVRADKTGTDEQRAANVQAAQLAVQAAQNTLAKLQNQQPNAWDIRLAELDVDAAQNTLDRLQHPQPYDAQLAEVAFNVAVTKRDALQRGATAEDLAALTAQVSTAQAALDSARAAVPSAEAALPAAQARLDAVKQGPTSFDLRDAQLKLQQAQTALEQSRAQTDVRQRSLAQLRTNADLDAQALALALQQSQNDLAQLQANLADAQIVAPTDGRIVRANGTPGAAVQAFDPVVTLAAPGGRLVRSEITDADMPRLAVGERAELTLDSLPGQTFTGSVRDLPTSVVTQTGVVADRGARLAVTWGDATPDLGVLARVRIVVQQKDDVLIVPTGALHQVGKRWFVEYMDGTVKRSRTVEPGISTATDTEVVSGLQEGEVILGAT